MDKEVIEDLINIVPTNGFEYSSRLTPIQFESKGSLKCISSSVIANISILTRKSPDFEICCHCVARRLCSIARLA